MSGAFGTFLRVTWCKTAQYAITFTPILALNGAMGWTILLHRRWLNIIRLWNRLVDMDDDRLTKKVFVYDFNKNTNSTWC